MTSPFIEHRDKILGHYSTASWLRELVLAMWNGSHHQVGLSKLASVDHEHFSVALAMIQSYRQNGECDAAFMALARECEERQSEEKAAAQRSAQFEEWCEDAQRAIQQGGGRRYFVDDHYSWFERQFNTGTPPHDAAALAIRSNLDSPQ